ncbi:SpoIIE family protein phosphatase [Candidatus Solirubrobacter pratensis]|uniref:SpoIIE family protein phosphatase n=1 Tax=Candidatus Solirubrobacter pratensis TaxID=1298857 RepID=UPI0018C92416|nr:SpoIIE family protein phosphatase [Candidatus Solirubrobacter pratensis]
MPEPGSLPGGEMGRLTRSLDWSRTPAGPVEGWPESLRTSVSICLGSRLPVVVLWGPELVLFYNDAYRPMLGGGHPEALGRPARDVWREIWDVIGPMLQGVLERGEAARAEDQPLPLDREEAYFTHSFSPIHDDAGAVIGIFTAVTETTERVLSERRLRTIATLAERTAGARTVAEVVERARAALATNPDDLPFAEIRVGERAPAAPAGAVVLPAGAEAALIAGVNPRHALDERYREFLDLLAEQLAGAIATARGLEVPAELDRAKSELFSNVSHEFRTPLTLLLGPLADALADAEEPLGDAQRERVETAQRAALRLLRLVNALLDVSRLEAGSFEPALEPVDLGGLATDAADAFRSLVEGAGLSLAVELPPEPVIVEADPELLGNVLLNLLSNAFRFTFEGGIRIAVWPDGSCEIADSGVGVAEEDAAHLFERFHRVRGARARSHEGTGIGLALVRELVQAQGGRVDVQSRLGEGSAFTVTLALAEPGAKPRRRDPRADDGLLADAARWGAPAVTGSGGAGARVLVADDNADMRDYLVRLLGRHFDVTAAADGVQALELARGGGFDLVLADVMMPGLDGLELLRTLREEPGTERLPLIMLSARAGEEMAIEGLEAGADDYLVKPFSANELVARVRSALELARLREERAREAERVAETLQRSLLPAQLPELPELALAGRYVPAGHGLKVGGDWYDAVPLMDGSVVLAIGDVAGHGLRAAATMGQVSHALRAYAREDLAPAELMRRLDALVQAGDLGMTTCVCAQLAPATGELRWANAGHLPPLVLSGDGSVRPLAGPLANPLGVVPGTVFREGADVLGDGESLVLYTDGLVERRGPLIDEGIARLERALATDPDPDALLAALLGGEEPADDVALLIARRATIAEPEAELSLPARPTRLRDVRRWAEAWLRGNGLAGPRGPDLVLAIHEAAMNAVEHAYGLAEGTVEVRLRREGRRVEARVADHGRWRERGDRRGDRGRGQTLMRNLVDEVEIERREGGTVVTLRVEL